MTAPEPGTSGLRDRHRIANMDRNGPGKYRVRCHGLEACRSPTLTCQRGAHLRLRPPGGVAEAAQPDAVGHHEGR